jgi:hypothetical protein
MFEMVVPLKSMTIVAPAIEAIQTLLEIDAGRVRRPRAGSLRSLHLSTEVRRGLSRGTAG